MNGSPLGTPIISSATIAISRFAIDYAVRSGHVFVLRLRNLSTVRTHVLLVVHSRVKNISKTITK